jgi:hypothetical protein
LFYFYFFIFQIASYANKIHQWKTPYEKKKLYASRGKDNEEKYENGEALTKENLDHMYIFSKQVLDFFIENNILENIVNCREFLKNCASELNNLFFTYQINLIGKLFFTFFLIFFIFFSFLAIDRISV